MRSLNILQKKIKSYRKTFEKFGVDPKALQWASKKAAEIRYRQLLIDLDLNKKSILDIGCGFGDIIEFIKRKSDDFSYTGIDIVPEFIKEAKRKYPEHTFIETNYFLSPLPQNLDIVITSGTLNSNLEDMAFKRKAIKVMFDHAKQAVAFNMAGNFPQPENRGKKRVYYADSKEILNFCFTLTNKLIFRHHYHKKDFTIILFKKLQRANKK